MTQSGWEAAAGRFDVALRKAALAVKYLGAFRHLG
jgi:hypothetical protein